MIASSLRVPGLLAIGVLSSLLCAAAPARAEVDSELVKEGVAAYDRLEYQTSIELLHRALAETLTRDEKVVTYETLAFCQVALGDNAEAQRDFVSLLGVDPAFELDRTISPRVRSVFEAARAQVATGGPGIAPDDALPQVSPQLAPLQPKEGQAVELTVPASGPSAANLELFYRTRGELRFSRLTAPGQDGRFSATVPGMQVKAPALEYYLDLVDGSGAKVAGAGSLSSPLAISITRPPAPIYKRSWFWGVVGGVAGAAILAGVLAATLSSGIGPNTPATLTVMPH